MLLNLGCTVTEGNRNSHLSYESWLRKDWLMHGWTNYLKDVV